MRRTPLRRYTVDGISITKYYYLYSFYGSKYNVFYKYKIYKDLRKIEVGCQPGLKLVLMVRPTHYYKGHDDVTTSGWKMGLRDDASLALRCFKERWTVDDATRVTLLAAMTDLARSDAVKPSVRVMAFKAIIEAARLDLDAARVLSELMQDEHSSDRRPLPIASDEEVASAVAGLLEHAPEEFAREGSGWNGESSRTSLADAMEVDGTVGEEARPLAGRVA